MRAVNRRASAAAAAGPAMTLWLGAGASGQTSTSSRVTDAGGQLDFFSHVAINDGGTVALRATTDDGGDGIFAGSSVGGGGGPIATVADYTGEVGVGAFGASPS